MEPHLPHDEQSMREKIRQHEFPFDPKAWEAMQGLLDDQDRKPIPPPVAPPSGPQPGPSTNRLWWLLLLLLSFGAGSTTLILKSRKSSVGSTAANRNTVVEKAGRQDDPAIAHPEKFGQPARSGSIKETATGFPTDRSKSLAGENKTPGISSRADSRRIPVRKKESAVTKNAGAMTRRQAASNRKELPFAVTEENEQDLIVAKQPASENVTVDANTASVDVPAPAFMPFQSLEILPGILTDTLAVPMRSDSTIRPVPYQPVSESRRERGWIFGGNLNAVDYRPLRFSALPHLGYFWRYRLQPRTTVQGEMILKFVSGYDWRAEFFDMVPGGSTQVILENKRLLYIEVPFVLQRAYAPGQSWQIGLKPALTLPIAPYGSYSSANFGAPNRNYTAHEGIRYVDLGLVLGWEYRFNPRWALDVRYNQGLLDLTVDNFYQQRETHLNSDIQVSLRHFITKKTKKYEPKTLFPAPPAGL